MLIFEIAHNLGKSVYEIEEEMSYEEFTGWCKYFKQRPYGWREDNRTAMLLQAQGVKQKPEALFSSLADLKRYAQPSTLADSLVKSGLLNRLRETASRNNIDWIPSDD